MYFFANWGQSTPRGRGKSYKIWGKSAYYFYVCKITILQNSDFREITISQKNYSFNFHKCCSILSQIRDDIPLGVGVNPKNFVVNRPCLSTRKNDCEKTIFAKNSKNADCPQILSD
jgi:hypothetical protein